MRDLIESSGHINQLGYNEEQEIDSLLDEAERKIFSIARMSTKQRFVNMKTSLMDAWERFDKLHKSKGEIRGVPSGFPELDNLLAGFQKSDLIILAVRDPSASPLWLLDIARNVACKGGVPVGIFSLEMSTQSLVDRMIASEAHVDSWKLRTIPTFQRRRVCQNKRRPGQAFHSADIHRRRVFHEYYANEAKARRLRGGTRLGLNYY